MQKILNNTDPNVTPLEKLQKLHDCCETALKCHTITSGKRANPGPIWTEIAAQKEALAANIRNASPPPTLTQSEKLKNIQKDTVQQQASSANVSIPTNKSILSQQRLKTKENQATLREQSAATPPKPETHKPESEHPKGPG